MVSPQLIEEQAIPLAEVKEYVKEIEKRQAELDYRPAKTKEYVGLFTLLTTEQKDALKKELEGLNILRLKDPQMVKIIDFLPTTVDDVRILLQGYPVSISKKDMERIVEVVKKFKKQ
jgi:DNA-directed RNA polymerase subunit F